MSGKNAVGVCHSTQVYSKWAWWPASMSNLISLTSQFSPQSTIQFTMSKLLDTAGLAWWRSSHNYALRIYSRAAPVTLLQTEVISISISNININININMILPLALKLPTSFLWNFDTRWCIKKAWIHYTMIPETWLLLATLDQEINIGGNVHVNVNVNLILILT